MLLAYGCWTMTLAFPCFIRTEMRNGGLLVMSHGSKFECPLFFFSFPTFLSLNCTVSRSNRFPDKKNMKKINLQALFLLLSIFVRKASSQWGPWSNTLDQVSFWDHVVSASSFDLINFSNFIDWVNLR